MRDSIYMKLALELAIRGSSFGEVPIGAVIICKDEIISWAFNEKELRRDSLGHAEILALQKACLYLGRWRLTDCTLYSTLEPCPMCAGAMVNARLGKLFYGAKDPKAGAAGSVINVLNCPGLNHQVDIEQGLLEEECAAVLSKFFKELRKA